MKNKLPKISIVTPSYNQGQFIEDCIQSIMAQNYPNFEHIIIDACSTDNTIEIMKKYPNLIWVSEPDEGQSDAINKGVIKATGDWILWLNADDILLPNTFDKFIAEIIKIPNSDVIHGHVYFFDDKTNKTLKTQYFVKFWVFYTIFGIVTPPSTGTLFKTSVLKNNPLDKNFHYMMDSEWFMRCGKKIKVVNINDFFVKFRISSTNKTSVQILTNKLNNQQEKEVKIMYEKYVNPIFKPIPISFHKISYKIIRYILLTVIRMKKSKYIFSKYIKQLYL